MSVSRPQLQADEIDEFRRKLCEAALRKFAQAGYADFTIKQLADDLGCSIAKPYRYFRDKQDIFDAVRALAYERFAVALETAVAAESRPLERVRQMMHAYVRFGLQQPHAYRMMFELEQPQGHQVPPENREKQLRAWEVWLAGIREAVGAGVLDGDAEVVAHVLWAGVHGLVALYLAGKLVLGREVADLASPVIESSLRAHRPDRTS